MTSDTFRDILRRSVIAIASGKFDATGKYPELNVQTELNSLYEWLCDPALGERRFDSSRFKSLAQNPSFDEIKSHLTGRCGGQLKRSFSDSDALVVYVTGHGDIDKGAHYTVLKESDPAALSSTALPTIEMLRWLAEHQGLDNVLLIIDLCHAGHILEEVSAGLRRELPDQWIALLTTSDDAAAKVGAFTNSVSEALDALREGSDRYNTPDEPYLDSSIFIKHVKERLEKRHQTLQPLKDPYRISCCLPNPKYDPALPARVETAPARQDLAALQAVVQQDVVTHWGPRARVLPAEDGTGWAFTGRSLLVGRLIEFATGPSGTLVVSGRAGSGKSAVLARLVTCSDPLFRETHGELIARTQPVPPEGAVDVAVLATGKTAEQIATQISWALGASIAEPSPETERLDALLDAIDSSVKRREETVTVVIDALDEASDPVGLVLSVLGRLNPAGQPKMRLIVGVRSSGGISESRDSHQFRELADLVTEALSAERIPVDGGPYWQPGDLANYVEQILLQHSSPYSNRTRMARHVATVIENRAGRSYLLAMLVATQLIELPEPVDSDYRVNQLIAGGVADILDHDLRKSLTNPTDRMRAGLLLSASALAFGRGIPWRDNIWPIVANTIAPSQQRLARDIERHRLSAFLVRDTEVEDKDVEWLLKHRIGGYLVRDSEDGITVYRPFHEELRASLTRHIDHRGRYSPPEVSGLHISVKRANHIIARRLASLVESSPHLPPPAYIRRHLADHASAGGILDDTILTVETLPYLDETRLSHQLRLTEAPRQSAMWWMLSAWRGIRHRWSWESPEANAAALDMALTAITGLAPRRSSRPGPTWRPRWAKWAWGGTVISSEDRGPASIAFGTVEDREVLATGAVRRVRLWDAATGQALGLPMETPDHVDALWMATVQGMPCVAVASGDTISVWDAATGVLRQRHRLSAPAITFGVLHDRAVAVTRGGHRGDVWLLDVATGDRVYGPFAYGATVQAAALTSDISGGCRMAIGRQDGLVEHWTISHQGILKGPEIEAGAAIKAMDWAVIGLRPILATATVNGVAQLWDPDTGERVGQPCLHDTGIRDIALAGGDLMLLATATLDGAATIWDPLAGVRHEPLPHPMGVQTLAFGNIDGRAMLATASSDGITRLWDPARPSGIQIAVRGRIRGIALSNYRDQILVAASGDNAAYVWSGKDGQPVAEISLESARSARSRGDLSANVALGAIHGRPVLAIEYLGDIRLYDMHPRREIPAISSYTYLPKWGYAQLRSLCIDRNRALFAVASDSSQPISIIDLIHRKALGTLPDSTGADALVFLPGPERSRVAAVFRDRVQLYDPAAVEMSGSPIATTSTTKHLAVSSIDGNDLLAICNQSGVQLRRITDGETFGRPVVTSSPPQAVAFGRVNGRDLLLTAHYATLRAWNPRTGRLIAELPFGTSINSLAVISTPNGGLFAAVGGPGIAVAELYEPPSRP
jgi:WD40 repeat protein